MTRLTLSIAALITCVAGSSLAQDRDRQGSGDVRLFELPSVCQTSGGAQAPANASSSMPDMEPMGSAAGSSDAHRGYQQAMMKMQKPMMTGMMAKDPDVAWACAMIAHHSGAVEMSRVVLRAGDNPQIKKMAEKTISDQTKEIHELTQWLEKQAKR